MNEEVVSQDFWCATLDSKQQGECLWEHADEEISHHLIVEQICLGVEAKKPCSVEVTTRVASGEEKSVVICTLLPGVVCNCSGISLGFKEKVKFRLIGDGPVHLAGTHSQSIDPENVEDDSEDEGAPGLINGRAAEVKMGEEENSSEEGSEEDVDEDVMLEELEAARKNKLKTFMAKDKKAVSKPGPLSKKEPAAVESNGTPKVEEIDSPAVAEEKEEEESSAEEDDEDDEDDDDDDDDDEEDVVESDDEEEIEDDEEDGEEEEDDSEESPEEEEEEPAPVTKKRKTETAAVPAKINGKAAAAKPTESTPKAKKQEKKAQTPVAKPDINELKKKLMASPNLPKKFDKFSNLMKNAHKITDDKEIKSTWEFLQKSKK